MAQRFESAALWGFGHVLKSCEPATYRLQCSKQRATRLSLLQAYTSTQQHSRRSDPSAAVYSMQKDGKQAMDTPHAGPAKTICSALSTDGGCSSKGVQEGCGLGTVGHSP